jgi:hypothetical protein
VRSDAAKLAISVLARAGCGKGRAARRRRRRVCGQGIGIQFVLMEVVAVRVGRDRDVLRNSRKTQIRK